LVSNKDAAIILGLEFPSDLGLIDVVHSALSNIRVLIHHWDWIRYRVVVYLTFRIKHIKRRILKRTIELRVGLVITPFERIIRLIVISILLDARGLVSL
jgi:hypothetical protein